MTIELPTMEPSDPDNPCPEWMCITRAKIVSSENNAPIEINSLAIRAMYEEHMIFGDEYDT